MSEEEPTFADEEAYLDSFHQNIIQNRKYKEQKNFGQEDDMNKESVQLKISNEDAVKSLDSLFKNVIKNIEKIQQKGRSITGLSTGFVELDEKIQGLHKGDLIVAAARPNMGKTTFAINLIESMIFGSDEPAILFSMQNSAKSIVERLISASASIKQKRLLKGELKDGDWVRLTTMMSQSQLHNVNLYVDDTSTQLSQIRDCARKIAKKHYGKVGIVIVDHLQLMASSDLDNDREIITRGLKELAQELNCPVIALSQLRPSLELRTDKRPILSDMYDASFIEQYADLIMFIYRDELYIRKSEAKGIAEIILARNKNGPTSTVRLAFQRKFARFTNLSSDHYPSEDIQATASQIQTPLKFKI